MKKMFVDGYWQIGRIRRIPIRVHWTAPLAAVIFGRLAFVPVFWLAYLGLILVHELGHAATVLLCRARVVGIDLDGAGGLCHWRGDPTSIQRALIAWGGVIGQFIAGLFALALDLAFGPFFNEYASQVFNVFTRVSLFLAAYNLIPVRHLDGVEAWKIVPIVRERLQRAFRARSKARSVRASAKAELKALDAVEVDEVSPEVIELLSRLAAETKKKS